MATKMGWFDVPLGAETRQLVSTSDQAIEWINTNFGKPLKYYNSAADMRSIWRVMLTNGIIPEIRTAQQTTIIPETQLGSAFSVSMQSGLNIQINPGIGWIDGAYCIVDEPIEVTVAAGTITDITLRLDMSGDDVTFAIAQKTRSAGTPQAALIRTGGIYELGLHSIEVPPGTETLTTEMITDLRLDVSPGVDGEPCCGIVGSLLQPDITALVDRTLKAFQKVLDTATPPDGNLATGIFLVDDNEYFTGPSVQTALNELHETVAALLPTINKTYAKKSTVIAVSLSASGWVGDAAPYTQTVTVEGVAADTNALADYVHADNADDEAALMDAWACIAYFAQGDGTVTAMCLKEPPGQDIAVNLIVIG